MSTHPRSNETFRERRVDWITLGLIGGTYAVWALMVFGVGAGYPWLAALVLTPTITMHSSLVHESVHGHPFRIRQLNEAIMSLPLGLLVPYGRFRDLHLAHHRDSQLTDPYDDPESNYLDPAVWRTLAGPLQRILLLNNTLAGRILIGPLISQIRFMRDDWRAVRAGDRSAAMAWAFHIPGCALVVGLVFLSGMPLWTYFAAVYAGNGLLRIRTFLEHRAHETSRARTVIIEDRGPLAFLFLNNNLHAVHHAHPGVPWHALPLLYSQGRERYLRMNDGYVYRSYGEVFRRYFRQSKDPVAHPFWPWKV